MTPEELATRVTDRLLSFAASVAHGAIRSKALKNALGAERESPFLVKLTIPHYWAIYVHDGRRALTPPFRTAKFLAWFRDPTKDPRLIDGEGPQRLSEVHYLRQVWSREQFKAALASGDLVLSRFAPATIPGERFFTTPPMSEIGDDRDLADQVKVIVDEFVTSQLPPSASRTIVLPL